MLNNKKIKLIFAIILAFWLGFVIPLCVKLVQKRYFYPKKYQAEVEYYSKINNFSPYLIYAVILQESSFNKNAVSYVGAVGLMQVMPKTATFIAKSLGEIEYDLFDAKTNIKFGTYYLRYLLDKFSVLETALLAYNAGEGTVKNWLKDSEYSKDGVTVFHVPFKETREYLEKILKYRKKYQKLYAKSVDK